MDFPASFGYWLRRRRKALDLTQEELGRQVGCSEVTIRKIEAEERRPSRQIAERLAEALAISPDDRMAFLKAARGELSADRLAVPPPPDHTSVGSESPTRPLQPAGPQPGPAIPIPSTSPTPVLRSTVCPVCGATVPVEQRFCGQCGAAISQACTACGMENPAGNRFCSACGAALDQVEPQAAAIVKERSVGAPRDERRWATVLFVDFSGYTAMSERMDPEDVKVLVARGVEQIGEQIRRFGGTVINVMGDAVLAVFGAPLAHEDDAERAVRAALVLRDSLLFDDPTQALKLHIGINTGEVLATVHGPQERRDYTVLGDTVNTADRILKGAPAGSVLVGEESYRATRHVVQYRELSPVVAKGKERPVPVWEALDVAAVPKARPLGTAPLVGRDDELMLLSRLRTKVACDAQPHLVLILGEPGIGKSRLVDEFVRSLPVQTLVLHGRCLPYGEMVGYGALALALKEAAGITTEDTADTARARLSDLVASAIQQEDAEGNPIEIARHLALLSGLDVAQDRSMSAADQRSLHMSVRRFLEALARRRPLCVIFEDIHWADDALLDLIEFVASRAHDSPLLIVTQARWDLLEKRPAWGRAAREITSVRLQPLDEHAGRDLILALCRRYRLSDSLAEHVRRQAGGNPLFIEELVAMIAERGEAHISQVPSAVKMLLAARMDALPAQDRLTLQLAAVFGKVFWASGLPALGAPGDATERLERLEQKDLVRSRPRSQVRGDWEYAFKHELIRDVAYETLPRAERRALHGRVADWIELAVGDQVEGYFDLLAHHAVEAGQQERAIEYLTRAAERTRRAAAHREEAALLAQAIALAEQTDQHVLAAELRARRGKAFASVGMWSDARQSMETALAGLAPERGEQRAQVLVDLANVCFWALDPPSLRRYATEALATAEAVGREDLAAEAITWLAEAEKLDGRLMPALDLYRRGLARAGGVRIAQLVHMPLTLYLLGQHDEAVTLGREAAQLVREMNDTAATVYGLPHVGLALAASGQYNEATRVFEEAQRLGREHKAWPWLARATAMSAGFHLDVFDFAGNEALVEEARELARSASFLPTIVSAGIDLLLNFARCQEVGRTERLLDEVAEAVEKTANWHGWLWKMRLAEARAEIALARGDWEAALPWANSAIEQANERGRVKYQVLALGARAQALAGLGRMHAAIADLCSAVDLARPVGDPALFLRAASGLLVLEGDDALAAEARAAADRIVVALPDVELRRRFQAAEPVRLLERLRG